MKRLFVIIFSLAICHAIFSQNLKLAGSVVSSHGDYSSSTSNKLSWTLGEPVIDVLTGANHILTIGFQQNWENIVAVEDVEYNWQIIAYPNPVTDKVFIRFANPGSSEIIIELLNVMGGIVISRKMNNLINDEQVIIDVSGLRPGMYLLHIYSPRQKTNKVYKVIKQ